MVKSYNIENTHETGIREYCPFNIQGENVVNEYSSTYTEVLRIFREAFCLIDVSQIIKDS